LECKIYFASAYWSAKFILLRPYWSAKFILLRPIGVQNLFCFGLLEYKEYKIYFVSALLECKIYFAFGPIGVQNLFCFFAIEIDIAFPDLMTYSYIKKIEPQNKFCTPSKQQNKFCTPSRAQINL